MATAAAVLTLDATTAVGDAAITAAIAAGVAIQGEDQFEEIAAGIAIAGLSLYFQDAYLNLAQNYYNLYNQQRQFYYSNFQSNAFGELGLENQVFSIPFYNPEYTTQNSNFAGFESGGGFSSVWWQNHANMYHDAKFNTSPNAYGEAGVLFGEPELLDRAATFADFDTYLYRYEEHRSDVYNERTWEWQNQSLNFGVKQASVVESGLATSFPFLDQATNSMADFFATQANGLATYGAYKGSLASNGARLSAATSRGRGLAFGTNLGVDRSPSSYETRSDLRRNNDEELATYMSLEH